MAKGSGESFLRGELLRYLAELPWAPMAIVRQNGIEWKQVDQDKVTGAIAVNGVVATVEYSFDQNGLIKTTYVPDREMLDGDQVQLKPWLGEFSQYEERGGVLIPVKAQVSWLLEDGKFTYFEGRIMDYQTGGSR